VMIHYEEALYQVYAPLPLPFASSTQQNDFDIFDPVTLTF